MGSMNIDEWEEDIRKWVSDLMRGIYTVPEQTPQSTTEEPEPHEDDERIQ